MGCQLFEDRKAFDYEMYNSSFGIFDFGFYEVPQSLDVTKDCAIYVTGTTSKMHDPTDYLFLKFTSDGKLDNPLTNLYGILSISKSDNFSSAFNKSYLFRNFGLNRTFFSESCSTINVFF